jgi:protein gp37
MAKSPIEWTSETWNALTGCTKVSPGCQLCYAEKLHKRLLLMDAAKGTAGKYSTPFSVVRTHDADLEKPVGIARPTWIFVNSMSDMLHADVPLDFIMAMFTTMIDKAPQHKYQILSKRADRWDEVHAAVVERWGRWPSHVLPGVSVESAAHLDRLIPLSRVGDEHTVRMVSAEPLLGSLAPAGVAALAAELKHRGVGWLIAGGESGGNPKTAKGTPGMEARPCDEDWLRELRDACGLAAVPFFLKQLGGKGTTKTAKRGGELAVLDGERHEAMPVIQRPQAQRDQLRME